MQQSIRRSALRSSIGAIAAILAACSGDSMSGPADPSARVSSVLIEQPASTSFYAGTALQLAAKTNDAQGKTLSGRTVSWSSSNTSALTVTPSGMMSAMAFGSSTVTATSEGVSATIVIGVRHDPIVFMHGFQSSGAAWATMTSRFKADGWDDSPLFTWTYDSNVSNATTAEVLQQKVDSLLKATGAKKVDIIAHSMGGLPSRYYAKNLGGSDKIDALVLLASPDHGTSIANLCSIQPCLEMRPGSTFLTTLNAVDETPGPARYATWWTPCDEAVKPPESVILKGAANTETACITHNSLSQDVTVYTQVRDWVK